MTDYQSTLLELLSRALFDRTITLIDTDWIEVLKEAKNQAITQLADSVVDKSG
jgi:hypothetical protein